LPIRGLRAWTDSGSRSIASTKRADVILDRPPFNIIEMSQRNRLRLVLEAIDEEPQVRIIVLRAAGEHFSSGGNIRGFSRSLSRACFAARLEYRGARAVRQAGHRREPRLLPADRPDRRRVDRDQRGAMLRCCSAL
jgi:enoyl-CoA hydratase/carnithine racemase